ncbi:hypothetical protein KKC74_04240, partial [bacterium]|nr:hypothetical protein [bacterium]
MSVQYDKEIFSNENLTLKANFSGIKGRITNTSDLKMSIYAYDKNTGAPIFSEVLCFDEIKSLYEHLNQISIIKDSTQTTSGKFIETTGGFLDTLNKLKGIDSKVLNTVLDRLKEDKYLKQLENDEDAIIEYLFAEHKHQVWQIEIDNLEKLLQLEEAGNIVKEIKKHEDLKPYMAGQPEKIFEKWITNNIKWVFGIEYIKKHDFRKIALLSEVDISMESIDGFLDLIEL